MTDRQRIMRELGMNDPLAVTLPVHLWVGFMAAYGDAKWNNVYANSILTELKERLFDPEYVAEREAEDRAEEAARHNDIHTFLAQQLAARGVQVPMPPPERRSSSTPPDTGAYP